MRELWENPSEFEEGSLITEHEGLSDEDYILFKFAFLAGIDYERTYPTGQDDYEV